MDAEKQDSLGEENHLAERLNPLKADIKQGGYLTAEQISSAVADSKKSSSDRKLMTKEFLTDSPATQRAVLSGDLGFNNFDWTQGVRKIWDEDGEFQSIVVRHILKEIRGVHDEGMLDLELESAKKDGLFFCPDDSYMLNYLGDRCLNRYAGIYEINGMCRYTDRLVIPIYNFSGEIPGFIGYSNDIIPEEFSVDGGEDSLFVKYRYPPKGTLIKGRFMYIRPEEYLKAIRDGYICIVDGIFDKRRLTDYGINAVSLMGSSITFWHRLYLSKIKSIVVIRDNDEAGYRLYRTCKKLFPQTIEIAQGESWDIDDFLKKPDNLKEFLRTFEKVKRQGFLVSEVIRKPLPSRMENLKNAKERKERTDE